MCKWKPCGGSWGHITISVCQIQIDDDDTWKLHTEAVCQHVAVFSASKWNSQLLRCDQETFSQVECENITWVLGARDSDWIQLHWISSTLSDSSEQKSCFYLHSVELHWRLMKVNLNYVYAVKLLDSVVCNDMFKSTAIALTMGITPTTNITLTTGITLIHSYNHEVGERQHQWEAINNVFVFWVGKYSKIQ